MNDKQSQSDSVYIQRPNYGLKAYLAMQMLEIREHKYYLSIRRGYDVGFDYAIMDWATTHAKQFRKKYFDHLSEIENICYSTCPKGCRGVQDCHLSSELVHKLLED